MKKAILLLSIIVICASCDLFTFFDLSDQWTGTTHSQENGTQQLDVSLIHSGNNLTGTWSSGMGFGGNASGSVTGRDVNITIHSTLFYTATINATVSNSGKKISGTGTDQGGQFTVQIRKFS